MNWCWLNNSTNVAAYTFTPTLLFCILLRKESEKEFNSSQFDWEQGEDAGKEDWWFYFMFLCWSSLFCIFFGKSEIWLFRTKWGCLGRGIELIYITSLMYYLSQYLISFLETQNDGYWEQDGDAVGGWIYLSFILNELLISIVHIFFEIQNAGYWEQDGDALGGWIYLSFILIVLLLSKLHIL